MRKVLDINQMNLPTAITKQISEILECNKVVMVHYDAPGNVAYKVKGIANKLGFHERIKFEDAFYMIPKDVMDKINDRIKCK